MIIGVPLFAVIYKIITEITNRLLQSKGLSTSTADYVDWNYPPRPNPQQWRRSTRKARRSRKKRPDSAAPAGEPETENPPEPEDPQTEQDPK